MNAKNFSTALGNISDKYIEESVTYENKKPKLSVKWISVAACISIILVGGIIGMFFHPNDPTINNTSYFTITSYAKNGDPVELSVASSFFNSTSPESRKNIFGVDMPLFHFDVSPSGLKEGDVLFSKFDISVSYNGNEIGEKMDKHVMVGFTVYSVHSKEQQWGYFVSGWFTEPTDIVITITDKDLNEIVERITVNVTYLADIQEYELKIIDWEMFSQNNS